MQLVHVQLLTYNNNNNNFSSLFHLGHQATAKYGPTHTGYED